MPRPRSARSACSRCRTARSTSCPGRCQFTSTCARHDRPGSATRCVADVLAELQAICERRGVALHARGDDARRRGAERRPSGSRAGSARSTRSALPVHRMPSGAGHDAMKLHEVMPQAMLFVRGENAGISHNPLESSTTRRHRSCASRRSGQLLDEPRPKPNRDTEHDAMTDRRPPRRLDRRALRRGGALPAGAGARADRHAAGQQRAARRAHGRAAARASASPPSSIRCPTADVQRARPGVDHQPGRAPPLRRRADDRPERARRRRAARRRLDATTLRRRDRGRQALRPRRGGEQERLRDLHLRRARARVARRAAAAAASSCTSPTTRNSAASSGPGWLLAHRPRPSPTC